jgi:hypothetical protein
MRQEDDSQTMPDVAIPSPPSPLPKWVRLPDWAIIVLSIIGVMALCYTSTIVLALGQHIVLSGQATATAQASATAYALAHPSPTATAALSPTATSPPTATPKPLPKGDLLGATFGGTAQAFYDEYGAQPDNLWSISGNVTFSISLTGGIDGQQHVFGMLAHPSDAIPWTMSQAEQACTAFLPPDARYQSTTGGGSDVQATYHSADLAATFASFVFGYDAPGSVVITYAQANGSIFQCSLGT